MKSLRLVSVGAVAGLTLILGIRFLESFWELPDVKAREKAEKEIVDRAKLANLAERNQIPMFRQLIITDYSLSNKPPIPPNNDWKAVNIAGKAIGTDKVFIYDMHQRCVGHVENGKFKFIKRDETACKKEQN